MLIREAKKEDARAVASFIAMAESEMVHHFTGTTDPEKSVDALLEFILSPVPNRYSLGNNLVAEIDGQAVASAIAFPADSQPELDIPIIEAMNRRGYNLERLFFEGEPGTFYLSTMGVNPAYRGRGVGSTLMQAAQDKGKRLGFKEASLLVSKGKPKVQALYERTGFKVVADIKIADVEYCRMTRALV